MIHLTSPTQKAYISSAWGADRSYRGGVHEGMDFPDDEGSPVFAANYGVVIQVDNKDNSFAGNWIAIQHIPGFVTRYMHNLVNYVSVGQRVHRGQKIGLVGKTGTQYSKPHVHFDTQIDPSLLGEYKSRYGTPNTGFGRTHGTGTSIPSETFMHGVSYRAGVLASSARRGVVLPNLWIDYAILAGVGAWLLSG